jgi:hypothetical protein
MRKITAAAGRIYVYTSIYLWCVRTLPVQRDLKEKKRSEYRRRVAVYTLFSSSRSRSRSCHLLNIDDFPSL